MSAEWEIVESGPAGAGRTVLLIPGGLNAARSYAELMAQPALSGVRLVAVTLPGHAGAPPPEDFSIETCARLAADLTASLGCDAVVGFSLGATVALEMAASGAFSGVDLPEEVSGTRQGEISSSLAGRHPETVRAPAGQEPGLRHGLDPA